VSPCPFCTGRRPKPEIVASKEQQIQRDDPGTSTQSSNQSDNSRLSRKALPELGKEGGRGVLDLLGVTVARPCWGWSLHWVKQDCAKLGGWSLAPDEERSFLDTPATTLGWQSVLGDLS